jgi:hypothetical protein
LCGGDARPDSVLLARSCPLIGLFGAVAALAQVAHQFAPNGGFMHAHVRAMALRLWPSFFKA